MLHAELDDDRKGELSKLAAAFKNDFPHLQRAVNYYGGLMDDNRPRQPPPVLRFVEAGPHAGSRVGVVELGQRPPPPKPFHLKVKFHRGWPSLHLPSGGKSAKPLCYDVQCVCCILNFGFQHLTSAFLESSGSTIGCRAALTACNGFRPLIAVVANCPPSLTQSWPLPHKKHCAPHAPAFLPPALLQLQGDREPKLGRIHQQGL